MSTQLAFPFHGLQLLKRNNSEPPKLSSIEKSLAELDSLLAEDQPVPSSFIVAAGEASNFTESKNKEENPSNEENNRNNNTMRFPVIRRQNSKPERSRGDVEQKVPLIRPRSSRDSEEVKSICSGESILSKDGTVQSEGLISNIDQVRNSDCHSSFSTIKHQALKTVPSRRTTKSAPTSRSASRDRGGRSFSRGPHRLRGLSLEREIKRMIIELSTAHSHSFVPEEERPTASTEDILNDLLTTTLSNMTGNGSADEIANDVDLNESGCHSRSLSGSGSDLRDLSSLLDQESDDDESCSNSTDKVDQLEDQTISSSDVSLEYRQLSNASSLVQQSSYDESTSETTARSDPLKIPGLERRNSIDEEVDSREDIFAGLPTYSGNISMGKLTAKDQNIGKEMSDESTSMFVSRNFADLSPPDIIAEESDSYSESASPIFSDNSNNSNSEFSEYEGRQQPPPPPTTTMKIQTTFSGDKESEKSLEEDNNTKLVDDENNPPFDLGESEDYEDNSPFNLDESDDDDEWTSFGGSSSFFGETFSPEKITRKQALDISEPNSPSSVLGMYTV
mmetsp:Transcript_28406/g.32465  ORF Transcript_28406/g.32465 Transcript_28406/m.32465 type:complete len:563 (+) Transcript_28406:114-1802(+)|eukprot:CAMPEP_0194136566 /NCGR_PEP_ID=MMETSP0152-20130528/6570_1 /TAXON_ID=1049557 /ORGANISM="Thalassiothrix antarctica, Strain L6-D1" /LENGTH=562 /DNA_ID=CAMNT_0038833281 /DNA_START=60 /DNA_END=1748 /DNA_ORIENTATION=-